MLPSEELRVESERPRSRLDDLTVLDCESSLSVRTLEATDNRLGASCLCLSFSFSCFSLTFTDSGTPSHFVLTFGT